MLSGFGYCYFWVDFDGIKASFGSPPTVYVLRHQWVYSCEKAKQELDYSPSHLKEG
ncbi:putative farnesol dehydrogenase (NAD(+)) [Rosa chinensis]|uniref:Putative farnesol dehydrogenase (NAD(+)) n=1 Tax=Rosa chinensis TaxID=74649 RepID=A0A2P6QV66_ROSCH|nr:putative farnesol dehydrogenase (NAD(+)) [Rosa chinensis]